MRSLYDSINPSFANCLQKGIEDSPKGAEYVAVHVSSWHMSIFCEYYKNLDEVKKTIAQPLIDPMCYDTVKLVWEIKAKELVYYDVAGLISEAHNFWKENKDNPAAKEAVCVGNVKDLFPEDPHKNKSHYCQFDPGSNVCYFCGKPKEQ